MTYHKRTIRKTEESSLFHTRPDRLSVQNKEDLK